MRIALIADIHGNLAALDAVLDAVTQAGIDDIVCLGDVAATGPQPREVLARLQATGCPVVMGNADAELLAPGPPTAPGSDQARFAEIDRWVAEQLSPPDFDYLRSFQSTIRVSVSEDHDLLCVHGSPRSFNDVIVASTPDDELAPMLNGHTAAIIAGGHTHFPLLRRYRGTLLVNPGSVGLAYVPQVGREVTVPALAEYATLSFTRSEQEVSFHRVAYDQAASIRAMTERGMPHAAWWSAGWESSRG